MRDVAECAALEAGVRAASLEVAAKVREMEGRIPAIIGDVTLVAVVQAEKMAPDLLRDANDRVRVCAHHQRVSFVTRVCSAGGEGAACESHQA